MFRIGLMNPAHKNIESPFEKRIRKCDWTGAGVMRLQNRHSYPTILLLLKNVYSQKFNGRVVHNPHFYNEFEIKFSQTLNGISKFRSCINYVFHSLMTEFHVWLTYLHSSAPNTNHNIITMKKATNIIVFDKSF